MIALIKSEQQPSPFKGMPLSRMDMERLLAWMKIQSQECVCRTRRSGQKNICSIHSRKIHKYSTGTDGCRILCHQFSTSSLPLREYCIKRCSTFWSRRQTPQRNHPPVIKHRRPGPKHPTYGIPASEWPTVVQRVVEQKEPLRTVAAAYGVSHETIRRIMLHVQKQQRQARSVAVL